MKCKIWALTSYLNCNQNIISFHLLGIICQNWVKMKLQILYLLCAFLCLYLPVLNG